jgi:hypothetical protein
LASSLSDLPVVLEHEGLVPKFPICRLTRSKWQFEGMRLAMRLLARSLLLALPPHALSLALPVAGIVQVREGVSLAVSAMTSKTATLIKSKSGARCAAIYSCWG